MKKSTFWINSTFPTKDGADRIKLIFATDEAATVEELVRVLQTRGIVYGEKLAVATESDGSRIIRGRQPMGLAAGGIASVQPFDHALFEPLPRGRLGTAA